MRGLNRRSTTDTRQLYGVSDTHGRQSYATYILRAIASQRSRGMTAQAMLISHGANAMY
jgi:hypothetical protein